jgi:hypothetical protein
MRGNCIIILCLKKTKDIPLDFNKWWVRTETVGFGTPSNYEMPGWNGGYFWRIKDNLNNFKKKHKIWPFLTTYYAEKIDGIKEINNSKFLISNCSENAKNLLNLFCFHGARIVILKIDITLALCEEDHFSSGMPPLQSIANHPKLYELLSPELWAKNNIYPKNELALFYKSPYQTWFRNDFDIIFGDIWRKSCLEEGRATISIWEYTKLINALFCLYLDLLLNPLSTDVGDSYKMRIGCYANPNYEIQYESESALKYERWKNKSNIIQIDAFKLRVLDAIDYINEIYIKYHAVSPSLLEKFICEMYMSFADELIRRKLVSKCQFCGRLFSFKKKKLFCTMAYEKRDCGKKERNKRYYIKNKVRILPKIRKATKDLRALYNTKGIRK